MITLQRLMDLQTKGGIVHVVVTVPEDLATLDINLNDDKIHLFIYEHLSEAIWAFEVQTTFAPLTRVDVFLFDTPARMINHAHAH